MTNLTLFDNRNTSSGIYDYLLTTQLEVREMRTIMYRTVACEQALCLGEPMSFLPFSKQSADSRANKNVT